MAEDEGITLRLIGGLAVRFHCHGPHSTHLRTHNDIDLIGLKKESKKLFSVFQKLSYSPNLRYNFLYGATRLQFIDQEINKHVDVFLDRFRMDHTLDFRERLHLDNLTIPITDLLLTKLQIVKLTAKDVKDIIAILEDHEIGYNDSQEMLNADYISELCSSNWGLHKTITDNLSKMIKFIKERTFSAMDKKELESKLEIIQNTIKMRKKKLRWKLRGLIGEKVKWYEEVEMVKEKRTKISWDSTCTSERTRTFSRAYQFLAVTNARLKKCYSNPTGVIL